MGTELLEMASVGSFVVIGVGLWVHGALKRRKERALVARFQAEREQLEVAGAQSWEALLPAQLDAMRAALERLGLRSEPASRHDLLRCWDHFGLSSDNDLALFDDDDALAGVTGRGVLDGEQVALTLSASRAKTFTAFTPTLGVLWRVDMGARLPERVELTAEVLRWGDDHVRFRESRRVGDTFRAVFDGFAEAHDQLTAHDDVKALFQPYRLAEGALWLAYQVASTQDVDGLVEHVERGRVIVPTVEWPASWADFGAASVGMLGEAPSESLVFERLLDGALGASRESALDLLVDRVGRGDGHAMHLLGQRAPELVDRLDAHALPRLLDAARAARDQEGPYYVSWAMAPLSPERWLTASASPELRADLLRELCAQGVDTPTARALARELFGHPSLHVSLTSALLRAAVEANNPALVPGVVARPAPILAELAELEAWDDYRAGVARLDYVLRMAETSPDRVREVPELERFLLDVLPLAMEADEGSWKLRVCAALGHVGSRDSVPALHAIEERALVGLGDVTRAARAARASIIARIGDSAHGGLSVADGTSAAGGLSVSVGEAGGLTVEDDS